MSLNLTIDAADDIDADGPGSATTGSGGGASSLLTSLVASWKFDESSGNAADATGRSNTLTNNNTVTYNTGQLSNAAYFASASSQYFSIASNSDLTFGDIDFTWAAWIYTD